MAEERETLNEKGERVLESTGKIISVTNFGYGWTVETSAHDGFFFKKLPGGIVPAVGQICTLVIGKGGIQEVRIDQRKRAYDHKGTRLSVTRITDVAL